MNNGDFPIFSDLNSSANTSGGFIVTQSGNFPHLDRGGAAYTQASGIDWREKLDDLLALFEDKLESRFSRTQDTTPGSFTIRLEYNPYNLDLRISIDLGKEKEINRDPLYPGREKKRTNVEPRVLRSQLAVPYSKGKVWNEIHWLDSTSEED